MCYKNIFENFFEQLSESEKFNEEDLKTIINKNLKLGLEQIIIDFRDCYNQIVDLMEGISLPTEQDIINIYNGLAFNDKTITILNNLDKSNDVTSILERLEALSSYLDQFFEQNNTIKTEYLNWVRSTIINNILFTSTLNKNNEMIKSGVVSNNTEFNHEIRRLVIGLLGNIYNFIKSQSLTITLSQIDDIINSNRDENDLLYLIEQLIGFNSSSDYKNLLIPNGHNFNLFKLLQIVEIVSKTLDEYFHKDRDINTLTEEQKYLYFNYILLTHLDDGLIHAMDRFVSISPTYKNIFSELKPEYKITIANLMSTTFNPNEDDINDMNEIPNFIKQVVSTVPRYVYKKDNKGKGHFEKTDATLKFDKFISAKQEIWNLIHKHKQSLKNYSTSILNEEYLRNIPEIIQEKYIDGKSLYDVMTHIMEEPMFLIPYVLSNIIDLYQDEDGPAYIQSISKDVIETLYSSLKGIYDFTEKGSFASFINGYTDPKEDLNLFLCFCLLFISTEKLEFIGYRIDNNDDVKRVDLTPDGEYYLKLEINRNILNHNSFEYNSIIQIDGNEKTYNELFELKRSEIKCKLLPENCTLSLNLDEIKNNDSVTLKYNGLKISYYDKNNNKTYDIIVDTNTGNIKFPKELNLEFFANIFKDLLQEVLTINELYFNNLFEDNDAKLKALAVGLPIFARRIINEIIINSNDGFNIQKLSLFGLREKDIAKDVFAINMIPDTIAAKYDDLIKDIIRIQGLDTSIMVKDGEGNLINNNKCSQVANKTETIWAPSTENDNYPAASLLIYDCFRGGKVIRDLIDKRGVFTKSTQLNPYEQWTSNLLYDFIAGFESKDKQIGIVGPVVSDKPFIIRLMMDVHQTLHYKLENGELVRDPFGKGISIVELLNKGTLENLNDLFKYESHDFYRKLFNFVKNQFTLAKEVILNNSTDLILKLNTKFNLFVDINNVPKILNITSNFKPFNDWVENNIKGTEINKRDFISYLLHEISILDPNIKFIDNSVILFDKQGNLIANPLLIDYQLRYFLPKEKSDLSEDDYNLYIKDINSILSNKDSFNRPEWNNLTSDDYTSLENYGTLYFDEISSVFISDILRSNYSIGTYDEKLITPKSTESQIKLITLDFITKEAGKWIKNKTIYNSIISIILSENDSPSEYKISTRSNLLNVQPYSELVAYAKAVLNGTIEDNTGILYNKAIWSDPEFDITEAINILNNEDYKRNVINYRRSNLLRSEYYKLSVNGRKNLVLSLIKNNIDLVRSILPGIRKNTSENTIKNLIVSLYGNDFNGDDLTKKENFSFNNFIKTLFKIENLNLNDEVKINTKINEELKNREYKEIKIEFNPILTKYNSLSLLLNLEYLLSSVGPHLNHPIKGKTLKEIEKNCIGAQVKRNVTYSATKHLYILNTLKGIPDKLLIAIVKNLEINPVYNIIGDGISENEVPTQMGDDGAMYVYGPMNYLENYSLLSEAVGTDKKLFGSMFDAESGTGFILKCAGFPLNCDRIRNQPKLQMLYKKMGSKKWIPTHTTKSGVQYVDFTKDFVGNNIDFNAMNICICGHIKDGIFYNYPELYEDGSLSNNYYKVTKVNINEQGETLVTYALVDPNNPNNTLNSIEVNVGLIDNNYDLWNKVLGGMYSAEYHDNILTYNNCDKSNKDLADLMNLVGVRRDSTDNNKILSLNLIRQPLKESMVAYAATEGAVKQGASNVNDIDVYTDESYELSTMTLTALDLGVQLDAEHDVENTVISLMTQVINALSARGYSLESGNDVYEALKTLTMYSIQLTFDNLQINGNIEEVKNDISEIILNSLKRTDITDSNLLLVISNNIKNTVLLSLKFEILKQNIPLDEPSILRKILSNLTVSMQRSGVRVKVNGNLLVLVPSDGKYLLYDGKTLSEYGTIEQAEEYLNKKLQELDYILTNDIIYLNELLTQDNYKEILKNIKNGDIILVNDKEWIYNSKNEKLYKSRISKLIGKAKMELVNPVKLESATDIEIEGSYHYITSDSPEIKSITLSNPWIYWNFLLKIRNGEVTKVVKDITKPKDLGCEKCKFKAVDAKKLLIALQTLEKYRAEGNSEAITAQELYINLLLNLIYNIWDLQSIHDKWNLQVLLLKTNDVLEQNRIKQLIVEVLKQIQDDLWVLGGNPGKVKIYGIDEELDVDLTSLEYIPFEAIIPKVFKTEFGLTDDDKLSDILKDSLFFLRKLINLRNRANTENCDLSLIGTNFTKNLKLVNENLLSDPNYFIDGYTEITNIHTVSDKGKTYRINDVTGERMYTIPVNKETGNLQIRIFRNLFGEEIILTTTLNFFVNQNEHSLFKINDTQDKDHIIRVINQLSKSKNRQINDFIRELSRDLQAPVEPEKLSETATSEEIEENKKLVFDYVSNLKKYNNARYVKLRLLNSEYDSEVRNLENNKSDDVQFGFILQLMQQTANTQYSSFKDSLKFIASRTPAQCHLSFMAMKAAAFDTLDLNSAYVSRWLLWLQGSKK